MAVSRNTGQRRTADGRAWTSGLLGTVTRYDLLLAAVPLALLSSFVAHLLLSVSLPYAMAPTAVVGTLVLLDALFVNPPTKDGGRLPDAGSRSD